MSDNPNAAQPAPDRPLIKRSTTGMDDLARFDDPMELRCLQCGKPDFYSVGRLFIDPEVAPSPDQQALNQAFGFSGYFHCRHCGQGGPWGLTFNSTRLLMILMVEALRSPNNARIHFVKLLLFDGTVSRWPTQSEAHLKGLLEQHPDSYFLYSRLGNIYKSGDAFDLASEAYTQAVKLNEHDVESMHSLAEIHLARNQYDQAIAWYHRLLQHARHAPPGVNNELLRNIVDDALYQLAEITHTTGIPLPPLSFPKPPASKSGTPRVAQLRTYDTSREEDREAMIDMWVGDRAPGPASSRPALSSRPARLGHPLRPQRSAATHVGRNDPCPCGSGKKFKQCCMRKG